MADLIVRNDEVVGSIPTSSTKKAANNPRMVSARLGFLLRHIRRMRASGGHSFILLQNENAPDSSSRGTSVEQPSPRTAQEQCSNQPRRSEWHARASGRQTQANSAREVSKSASGRDTDKHLIEQIELDLLKSERNTDPTVMETALAEDYVNLTPTGVGPGKTALLENFREHAGEAPPYSVRQEDMNIFVLNDASAVAAYVKIYVAKENKNVAREDTTHVFTKKDVPGN